MKLNEFLKTIGTTIAIALPEDLSKLEIELPAEFDTKFSQNYLTRDRAKSDDEIITEITKKANKSKFTAIDDNIKEFLPLVSEEHKKKIESVFDTPEKIKLLKIAMDEKLKDAKGKLTPDDIRKVEDEWSGKYKALQDQAKAEKEALARQMEEKNFDFYVTQKLAGYNVAKEFQATRESLNAMGVLMLKQKGYKYEFENGSIRVMQEKDGVPREVYEGDKKVTFESLIDKFMDPFIAKSNGGDDKRLPDVRKKVEVDGKESLHDQMWKTQVVIP